MGHLQFFLDGRQQYWDGDLEQARKTFEAISKFIPETCPASQLLDAELALVDIERRLADGETVDLKFEPGLMAWDVRSGEWTVRESGEIDLQFGEQTGFFRLLHRARMGRDFEMTGEILFDKLKRQQLEFGPIIGCHRNSEGEQWLTCLCEREYAGKWYFDLLDRTFASNFKGGNRPLEENDGVFAFRVLVEDGKVSYWMNGLQVIDEHEPRFYEEAGGGDVAIREGDQVGICLSSRWSSALATVRKVTARRIIE